MFSSRRAAPWPQVVPYAHECRQAKPIAQQPIDGDGDRLPPRVAGEPPPEGREVVLGLGRSSARSEAGAAAAAAVATSASSGAKLFGQLVSRRTARRSRGSPECRRARQECDPRRPADASGQSTRPIDRLSRSSARSTCLLNEGFLVGPSLSVASVPVRGLGVRSRPR